MGLHSRTQAFPSYLFCKILSPYSCSESSCRGTNPLLFGQNWGCVCLLRKVHQDRCLSVGNCTWCFCCISIWYIFAFLLLLCSKHQKTKLWYYTRPIWHHCSAGQSWNRFSGCTSISTRPSFSNFHHLTEHICCIHDLLLPILPKKNHIAKSSKAAGWSYLGWQPDLRSVFRWVLDSCRPVCRCGRDRASKINWWVHADIQSAAPYLGISWSNSLLPHMFRLCLFLIFHEMTFFLFWDMQIFNCLIFIVSIL